MADLRTRTAEQDTMRRSLPTTIAASRRNVRAHRRQLDALVDFVEVPPHPSLSWPLDTHRVCNTRTPQAPLKSELHNLEELLQACENSTQRLHRLTTSSQSRGASVEELKVQQCGRGAAVVEAAMLTHTARSPLPRCPETSQGSGGAPCLTVCSLQPRRSAAHLLCRHLGPRAAQARRHEAQDCKLPAHSHTAATLGWAGYAPGRRGSIL